DMLNGPVYTVLVKDFWPRCDVVTQEDADREYANKVAEDPENNKGKGVTGYEVTLTQSNIAQVLKLPNQGIFMTFTPTSGKLSNFVSRISKKCYLNETVEPTNKVRDMKDTQRLLARIMFGSFFSTEGGTGQLSWDHRHFIYFLTTRRKINLVIYIFHHMCKCIRSAQNPTKLTPQVAYPRLLREIFYQCAVTNRIKQAEAHDLLEEQRASFINGNTLSNMKLIPAKSVKTPNQPLLINRVNAPFHEQPPVLFSNEPKEVILEYMRLIKVEGVIIT
ncbi:hypothetical protein A2U01_0029663, partial [Trifolium medium]|nr:hypothetical protein [Trifolium medium]